MIYLSLWVVTLGWMTAKMVRAIRELAGRPGRGRPAFAVEAYHFDLAQHRSGNNSVSKAGSSVLF